MSLFSTNIAYGNSKLLKKGGTSSPCLRYTFWVRIEVESNCALKKVPADAKYGIYRVEEERPVKCFIIEAYQVTRFTVYNLNPLIWPPFYINHLLNCSQKDLSAENYILNAEFSKTFYLNPYLGFFSFIISILDQRSLFLLFNTNFHFPSWIYPPDCFFVLTTLLVSIKQKHNFSSAKKSFIMHYLFFFFFFYRKNKRRMN